MKTNKMIKDASKIADKGLHVWAINKELLEAYRAMIEEDNLDIQIEEGESFQDPNGDTMVEVVVSSKEPGLIEENLDKCINSYYGLI